VHDGHHPRPLQLNATSTGFTNYEVVLRSLPENSGFGPPMVAVSRDDEMVGLAWITNRGVYARRVCPPYVGD